MADTRKSIADALQAIDTFIGPDLAGRIAELEWSIKGCTGDGCRAKGEEAGVTSALLTAAYAVKRAAGQIHVVIHAVGGLLLLPKIMERDEKLEYVSLGAGNMGKDFDLATDRRIAEFKFIHWQGGAETMRKKALFKDFYRLAEEPTDRRKELYVLGTSYPLRFLRGGSSLDSVMSRNVALLQSFRAKYANRFSTVGEYYAARQDVVKIIDASPLVPELVHVMSVEEAEEAQAEF